MGELDLTDIPIFPDKICCFWMVFLMVEQPLLSLYYPLSHCVDRLVEACHIQIGSHCIYLQCGTRTDSSYPLIPWMLKIPEQRFPTLYKVSTAIRISLSSTYKLSVIKIQTNWHYYADMKSKQSHRRADNLNNSQGFNLCPNF